MKKSALKVMASALFATFTFTGAAAYGAQNQDVPFVSSNLVGDVDYAELLTDQYSKDYQLKHYRDDVSRRGRDPLIR